MLNEKKSHTIKIPKPDEEKNTPPLNKLSLSLSWHTARRFFPLCLYKNLLRINLYETLSSDDSLLSVLHIPIYLTLIKDRMIIRGDLKITFIIKIIFHYLSFHVDEEIKSTMKKNHISSQQNTNGKAL